MHNILVIIIKQSKAHGHLPSPPCEVYFTVYMLPPSKLYNIV